VHNYYTATRKPTDFYPEYLSGSSVNNSGRERDSQRSKVYRAEKVLRQNKRSPLISKANALALIDSVISTDFWKQLRGPESVNLRVSYKATRYCWARYGTASIVLAASWGLNRSTILHELTHLVVGSPHPAHGKLFCRIFLHFVCGYMSKDSYRTLLNSFNYYGVSY